MFLARLLVTLPVLTLLACGSSNGSSEAADPATPKMPDVDLEALAIPFASEPLPGVLAAGQISEEQMTALKAAGYASFISLRVAEERGAGWEEAFAKDNDIRFVRLPIAGAADVDEAHARELATLMESEPEPLVVYCGSSNRVGALFALKALHLEGATPDAALELGKASGVTGLEDHLRDQLGL